MYDEYNEHEIKLAQEFAQALHDWDSIPYHLSNARKFNESFLRKQLETVLSIPQHKIRNSRAAYYVSLLIKSVPMTILSLSTNTRLVGMAIISGGELEEHKTRLFTSPWSPAKATQIIVSFL